MDAALTPPLRIQPLHVQQVSPDAAQKRVEEFLHKFHARNAAKHSGESTTYVQLQKLADALNEESPSAQ